MCQLNKYQYIARLESENGNVFWAGIEIPKAKELLKSKELPNEKDFFENAEILPFNPLNRKAKQVITGTEERNLREGKVRFLAPAKPEKIVAVGLNYIDHARELNMEIPDEPVIFLKPPSALNHHEGVIIYPEQSKQVDYEGELALVIAKEFKNATEYEIKQNFSRFVLGLTCFNDITARDLQRKDGQWTRAKSFDTFAPVGPWLYRAITPEEDFRIQTFLNGLLVQNSTTENFIFKIAYLLSFVSRIMTLKPGDIISTGTPPGVGPLKRGDTVEVKISKIGILRNRVA